MLVLTRAYLVLKVILKLVFLNLKPSIWTEKCFILPFAKNMILITIQLISWKTALKNEERIFFLTFTLWF